MLAQLPQLRVGGATLAGSRMQRRAWMEQLGTIS
jgi:hypothetical protein